MNHQRKSTLNPDVNEHEINILPCIIQAALLVAGCLVLCALFG